MRNAVFYCLKIVQVELDIFQVSCDPFQANFYKIDHENKQVEVKKLRNIRSVPEAKKLNVFVCLTFFYIAFLIENSCFLNGSTN